MAKCDEGYLCQICGKDVANVLESDLYLRYVIGQLDPELRRVVELGLRRERRAEQVRRAQQGHRHARHRVRIRVDHLDGVRSRQRRSDHRSLSITTVQRQRNLTAGHRQIHASEQFRIQKRSVKFSMRVADPVTLAQRVE